MRFYPATVMFTKEKKLAKKLKAKSEEETI